MKTPDFISDLPPGAIEEAQLHLGRWNHVDPRKVKAPKPKGQASGATRGGCSLAQVAGELGISKERARQIEKSAIRKLQRLCKARNINIQDLIRD